MPEPDLSSGASITSGAENASAAVADRGVTSGLGTGPAAGPAVSPVVAAKAAHHSKLGQIYDTFLDALGGKSDVSYTQDEQTGKLVPHETPRSHGEQWDHILAGAFTGLAAAGKIQGPARNNPIATFGAGASAGIEKRQEDDRQAKAAASDDVKRKRDTMLFNAQMAKFNQDTTESTWRLSQDKVNAGMEYGKSHKEFMDSVLNGDPDNRYLGVAQNTDDLMKMHAEVPGLLRAHVNAQIISMPHVNDKGEYDGVEYAMVTPEWGNRMITEPTPLTHWVPDTKGGLKSETVMLQPGTYRNKDVVAFKAAEDQVHLKWDEKRSEEENELKVAQMHEAGENARHRNDKSLETLQRKGIDHLQKSADDYQKFLGSASTIKNSIQSARDGNELAAAVEPLQGTLFVMAEGGVKRINRQELEGVKGAGSLIQNIEGYLGKIGKGDPIPEKLKADMGQLIEIYRAAKYDAYRKDVDYTMRLHSVDPRTTPIIGPDGKLVDPTSAAPGSPATQSTGWGSQFNGVQRQKP
jgi:hypothetical protein